MIGREQLEIDKMADSKPDLAAERFNKVASEWDEKPSTLSCTIKMAEAIKAK